MKFDNDQVIRFTVSVDVTTMGPCDATFEDLTSQADRALYMDLINSQPSSAIKFGQ